MLTQSVRFAKSAASKYTKYNYTRTPTSVTRSVFRKLSAPFNFTLLPKLISYRELKQLLGSQRQLLPSQPPQNIRKKYPILVVTVASPSPPAPGVIPKRKRVVGEMKYYAVRKGYSPGIYTTWKECLGQVTGFKGATCKFFKKGTFATLIPGDQESNTLVLFQSNHLRPKPMRNPSWKEMTPHWTQTPRFT